MAVDLGQLFASELGQVASSILEREIEFCGPNQWLRGTVLCLSVNEQYRDDLLTACDMLLSHSRLVHAVWCQD